MGKTVNARVKGRYFKRVMLEQVTGRGTVYRKVCLRRTEYSQGDKKEENIVDGRHRGTVVDTVMGELF